MKSEQSTKSSQKVVSSPERVPTRPEGVSFDPPYMHPCAAAEMHINAETLAERTKAYFDNRGTSMLITLLIIIGQAWIAYILFGAQFIIPAALAVSLLIASIMVYDPDHYWGEGKEHPVHMIVVRLLFTLIVGMQIYALGLLIFHIFHPDYVVAASELFITGVSLWIVNFAVFALAYWELDTGGPERRMMGTAAYPDLVFTQFQNRDQGVAPPNWRPSFGDYVYVSLTAATAFSPTDTMPMTKQAKFYMGSQTLISFLTIAMLVSKAVNML
jgi:hypothetical protein